MPFIFDGASKATGQDERPVLKQPVQLHVSNMALISKVTNKAKAGEESDNNTKSDPYANWDSVSSSMHPFSSYWSSPPTSPVSHCLMNSNHKNARMILYYSVLRNRGNPLLNLTSPR